MDMNRSLDRLVSDFAAGIQKADSLRPRAVSSRSEMLYSAGIGPHTETRTVDLVVAELRSHLSAPYADGISVQVPYPSSTRSKCDLFITWEARAWAIEVKMLRMMGDNGKPNDNTLMHILSPYSEHRSALTDCEKLLRSGLPGSKAILIYGYDFDGWEMDPAIEAFEVLAQQRVALGPRVVSPFSGLIHPVHQRGRVFGWEIEPKTSQVQREHPNDTATRQK